MKNMMLSCFIIGSFLFSINGRTTLLSEEIIENRIDALFNKSNHFDTPDRRERVAKWVGHHAGSELLLEFLEREWANENFPLFSNFEEAYQLCTANKQKIVFYISSRPGVISMIRWHPTLPDNVLGLAFKLAPGMFFLEKRGIKREFAIDQDNWLNGLIEHLKNSDEFSGVQVQQYYSH